jgi:hypothetical protein
LAGNAVGSSWNSNGEIIFGYCGIAQGSMRVSAAGGTANPLTELGSARKEMMYGPGGVFPLQTFISASQF